MVEDTATAPAAVVVEEELETRPPRGAGGADATAPTTRSERLARRIGVRPTSGSDEPHLDGLRAVAVLLVLLLHVHGASVRPGLSILGHDVSFVASTSFYGVDLFFVLSGFLLARPWFRAELDGTPRPRLGRFWGRRFVRVAPAYYVSIAVVLVAFVPSLVRAESLQGSTGVVNLASHLLFIHQYVPVASQNFNGVAGPYWTLTIEMTFYLMLPLVVPLFTGRRWRVALPLALAASLTWLYLTDRSLGRVVDAMVRSVGDGFAVTSVPPSASYMRALLSLAFPAWLFTFALGIVLARLAVLGERSRPAAASAAGRGPVWWQRPGVALASGALGLVLLLALQHQVASASTDPTDKLWTLYLQHLPAGAAMALIVYGVSFGPSWVRRPFSWLPLRILGWASFGVYLYHVPVIQFLDLHTSVGSLTPGWDFVVTLAVVLPVSVAFGLASWLVVERPLLVRGPRRTRTAVAAVLASAAALLVAVLVVAPVLPTPTADAALANRAATVKAVVDQRTAPPPPTPTLPRTAPPLLVAPPAGTRSPALSTGDATLADAGQRGVLYPLEQQLLLGCGSTELGTTLVLVADSWSVSGSAYRCADAAGTGPVVGQLDAWMAGRGFAVVDLAAPGETLPRVWFADGQTVTPGYPAQLQVFYASGRDVVALTMQATSRAAGEQGMATLLPLVLQQHRAGASAP